MVAANACVPPLLRHKLRDRRRGFLHWRGQLDRAARRLSPRAPPSQPAGASRAELCCSLCLCSLRLLFVSELNGKGKKE